MLETRAIKIAENQYIYVEVDTAADNAALPTSGPAVREAWQQGPEHSSPCGPVDDAIDALRALEQNIRTLAQTVQASFAAHQPEEWTMELNIGFKGTTSPIPVILSGEASAAIKISATWKKTS